MVFEPESEPNVPEPPTTLTMENESEPPTWPPSNKNRPWLKFISPQVSENLNVDRISKLATDYEFLNDSHFQSSGAEESPPLALPFTRFSQLPVELRLRIWEHCLPRQRLLGIDISAKHSRSSSVSSYSQEPSPNATTETELYQLQNELGNVVSHADYVLRMHSTGSVSPLLLVNREANSFVRQHYRVHIPVIGREIRSDSKEATTCLCFRPETDTVSVNVEHGANKIHFADFVHDALAYDPQGVGIIHIAIRGGGLPSEVRLPLQPSAVHSRARAALAHTLSKLQSISLIHIAGSEARQMFASLLHAETRFNRAFPLWSSAASFTVLPADPRPIAPYLDKVCVGWDPRALIRAWQMLEAAYVVLPPAPAATTTMRRPPPARRTRVLLAAVRDEEDEEDWPCCYRGIAAREEACRFRQREEDVWEGRWRAGGFHDRLWRGTANPDDGDPFFREFARTKNGVGFWSLPVEAFDDVPEVPYDTHRWAMSRVLDLTEFEARIECGLFEI